MAGQTRSSYAFNDSFNNIHKFKQNRSTNWRSNSETCLHCQLHQKHGRSRSGWHANIIFRMHQKISKMVQEAFFHLLDMAVYNAFVMYKMENNTSLNLSDFRLEIIRGILTKYRSQRPTTIGRLSTRDSPLRLTARHFPSLIPQASQSKQPQRKCVLSVHPMVFEVIHGISVQNVMPLYPLSIASTTIIQRWTTNRFFGTRILFLSTQINIILKNFL